MENKADTTEAQPHVIQEVEKTPKIDIRVEQTSTHNYNTRSVTKRVNHVTTFNNAPNMFQVDAIEKITHIDPNKKKSRCNQCKPTLTAILQVFLGYRDLVNMNELEWNNSMYNKLGCLSQG